MNTAFEQAYEAYVARKQAERQAQLLRLRQELLNSRLTVPLGPVVARVAPNAQRPRHAAS